MVTILPPKVDAGQMIGQGLGQGFGQGIARGSEIGFQRNLLNQAIQGLRNAKDPFSQAQALAQISMISPQAAQTLAPLLNARLQSGIYGGQNQQQGMYGGQNPQQGIGGGMQQPMVQPSPQNPLPVLASPNSPISQRAESQPQGQRFPENLGTPPANLTPGMDQQGTAQETGLTSHIRTPQEQEGRLGQLMSQYLIPYDQAKGMVEDEQKRAVAGRALGELKARQVLGIGGEEPLATEADMPDVMLLGEQLSHITDPDRWARALKDSWQNFQSAKTSLNKAFIPGFWRKLMTSKQSQREALDRLTPVSQKFVKLGMEQYLRKQLLDHDLSETQVEEQIHPWTEKNRAQLSSLPNGIFRPDIIPNNVEEMKERFPEGGLKNYEETLQKHPEIIQKQNTQLANWMKKNVTQDMSLNVLRNKLWKEKKYDWRQIASALEEAQRGENAIILSQRQGIEEPTVLTQAPLESLSDILMGWDRPIRLLQKVE